MERFCTMQVISKKNYEFIIIHTVRDWLWQIKLMVDSHQLIFESNTRHVLQVWG